MSMLLKKKVIPHLWQNSSLYKDATDLFARRRTVDLAIYFYSTPNFPGDIVRGAQLASKIWDSSYYYLRNGEAEILKNHAQEMAHVVGDISSVVEFGPGPAESVRLKTLALISRLKNLKAYTGVDFSSDYLDTTKSTIEQFNKNIGLKLLQEDFYSLNLEDADQNSLVLFLGNTIANIPEEGGGPIPFNTLAALKRIRVNMRDDAYFILGHDANEDIDSILNAYGQEEYTQYAMNVFHQIKRDLPTVNFSPENFESEIEWIADEYCLTRYAVSKKKQNFIIGSEEFSLAKGEKIKFCNSYKYPVALMSKLIQLAGFSSLKVYRDGQNKMAIHVVKPTKNITPLTK